VPQLVYLAGLQQHRRRLHKPQLSGALSVLQVPAALLVSVALLVARCHLFDVHTPGLFYNAGSLRNHARSSHATASSV